MKQSKPPDRPASLLPNSILKGINEVLSAALTSKTETEFGIICFEIVRRLTHSKFGFIGKTDVYEPEEMPISAAVRHSFRIIEGSDHNVAGFSFKINGKYGRNISKGKAFINNDFSKDSGGIELSTGHQKIKTVLAVPLVRSGRTIGIIVLVNRRGGYSLKEQRTVEALAPTIVESLMHKRAVESLQQSEKKFRNLIKYAPAVIYEMDIEGEKFLNINEVMCTILGYSPEELFLIKPVDLLDEASKLLFKKRIMKRLADEPIEDAIEYRVRKKNGEWLYVIINVGNISYSEGMPDSITVIAYDITERKSMEEALRESEKKYRELIKHAPSGIYEVDFRTKKFTSVNDSMCMLTGYSRDEILSMTPFEILDNEGRSAFQLRINKWLSGEKPDENVEYRVSAKDGHIIYALLNVKFKTDDQGNPTGAMVVAHDITERKKQEEALHRSQERLRLALEAADFGTWDLDLRTGIATHSMRHDQFFGYNEPQQEWSLEIALQHVLPEYRKAVNEAHEYTGKTDKVFIEAPVRWSDGNVHWICSQGRFQFDNEGHALRIAGIVGDITERKKVEEALREKEEHLRSVLENSRDAIYRVNMQNGTYDYMSPSVKQVVGYSADELIAQDIRTALDMIHNDDRPVMEKALALLMKEGLAEAEYRQLTKNGDWRWISNHMLLTKDNNGEPLHRYGNVRNITESKNAEEALRESEARFRTAFEKGAVGMGLASTDGKMIKVNDVFCQMLGYTEGELIGHNFTEFTYPDDIPENQVRAQKLLRDGQQFHMEKRYMRKDGSVVWADVNSAAVLDPKGKPLYVITHIQDITPLKKNEARLMELNATKDKFFNIVAHDLKNPFTSLIGSSEILYNQIRQLDSRSIQSLALNINDSAKSGYAILENLLAWSRSQTGLLIHTPEQINLKKLVEENVLNLQLFSSNKSIDLKANIEENIFFTSDKAMISLVLRNLISNAIKFTNRGGKIEITAKSDSAEIIFSIKDNGIGISGENIKTLFSLDTRHLMLGTEKEKGTGLGLKLCKEFVEKLNGKIWVESTPGQGSTFSFSIPGNSKQELPVINL